MDRKIEVLGQAGLALISFGHFSFIVGTKLSVSLSHSSVSLCVLGFTFFFWNFDVSSPLKKGPRFSFLTGESFREELQ